VSWQPVPTGLGILFSAAATPGLFIATCLQCRAQITLLVYTGPTGTDLAALPSAYGGSC
jgi:hypothetical protein